MSAEKWAAWQAKLDAIAALSATDRERSTQVLVCLLK